MAASAADIRSALSISAQPQSTISAPSQPKKQQSQSTRKPEGISRELYSLIGPSAPSLAAQLTKPKLKQKPNLGSRSSTKWEWRSFKNPARNDDLQLSHWVKAMDTNTEYPFAKYNVQSNHHTYTQDEYTRFLQDPEWTKGETDYLFDIVREFDTRWYVIYDRYEYPGGVTRSMEDLKDRYYSVCRKLIRNRPWQGDEAGRSQLLASFHFDKDREITRKKYVASLENRTPDQVAEEEALYIEIKRLEQTERRFKKDREELLRVLAGVESGLPDVIEDENPFNNLQGLDSKKKRKALGASASASGTMDVDTPTSASNVISLGPPIMRKPRDPKSAAYDLQHCIIRTDLPPSAAATKAAHQVAYMRSFKLPYPKAALAPKINQVFAELGINNTRLVMPTRDNCARLEGLMEAVTALVETKRVIDKVEYDIQVAKKRLGMRDSEEAGETSARGGKVGGAMDIDDADAEAEGEAEDESVQDGRAQSVVSTRSARSRRQSRRSMSISSVDTSATASVRGTKRKTRG